MEFYLYINAMSSIYKTSISICITLATTKIYSSHTLTNKKKIRIPTRESVATHFLITFLWHVKLKCIFNSRLSMLCRFHIDK